MLEFAVIFMLLLLIGFGLPVPEESTLLLAACFVATGSNTPTMIVVAVAGIAIGDTIQYAKGRFRSQFFKGFKQGKSFISRAGFFAMFTARFFISSRVVIPFMAGAMQMKRASFHAASVLGAVVLSTVLILAGSAVYDLLAMYTAVAAAVWMLLLVILTGVLVMFATRSQVQLSRE